MVALARIAFGDFVGMKLDCSVAPPQCTSSKDCGISLVFANIYFFVFMMLGNYVILNLFIAVILENFVFTYTISSTKLQEDLKVSEADLQHAMIYWDFFDPGHTGFIEIYPQDQCAAMVTHIQPPLGKPHPIPDYWLESLRLQLLRKSRKNRLSGARHVSLQALLFVTQSM